MTESIFPLQIREDAPNDILTAQGSLLCTVYPRTIKYPYPPELYVEACGLAKRIAESANACEGLTYKTFPVGKVSDVVAALSEIARGGLWGITNEDAFKNIREHAQKALTRFLHGAAA